MAFYEFVNNCRKGDSTFILIRPQELAQLGLVKMNKSNPTEFKIPKVVMRATQAAVTGAGFSMKIESPIAPRVPKYTSGRMPAIFYTP